MCGELDDQILIGQELLDRLRAASGGQASGPAGTAAPADLGAPEGRAAYMEAVFSRGLADATAAVGAAAEETAVDALALRAIALARLAGYLAGQLPPEADLFRAVIEAMTAGHAEPRETPQPHHQHHHHHHHPDHSH